MWSDLWSTERKPGNEEREKRRDKSRASSELEFGEHTSVGPQWLVWELCNSVILVLKPAVGCGYRWHGIEKVRIAWKSREREWGAEERDWWTKIIWCWGETGRTCDSTREVILFSVAPLACYERLILSHLLQRWPMRCAFQLNAPVFTPEQNLKPTHLLICWHYVKQYNCMYSLMTTTTNLSILLSRIFLNLWHSIHYFSTNFHLNWK